MSERVLKNDANGSRGLFGWLDNLAQAMETTEVDQIWQKVKALEQRLDKLEEEAGGAKGE